MKNATKFVVRIAKGLPLFQYLAVFSAFFNMLSCGLHYGWPSPSLPQLLKEDSPIPMTADQGSWIATVFLLGILCGANLGALILDKLGRKKVIQLAAFPFFVSWLMIAFAPSMEILLIARFIAGVSDGLMIGSLPMYIGEISNPKIRGLLGSCIATTMISGMLLMNILGSYLSIKTAALVCAAVPLLLLLTFSWMPESPYYLIMKGDLEGAKESLQIFKGTESVDLELERVKQAVEEQMANSGRYLDLFTVARNRKAVGIIMGLRGAQQLSGTIAITFYAHTVFKHTGDTISPNVATIVYFSMQLIFSGICSAIVDRAGRRPLMIVSITGTGLVLLVEGVYFYIQNRTNIDTTSFQLVPVVALVAFIIVFSLGMQVIPMVFIGELFPTNVKAYAISFCNSYMAIITTIVAKFFQITKDEFGLHVPFFVFAIFCVFGLIFIVILVPETKGKTLEQIDRELSGKVSTMDMIEIKEKFRRLNVY